MGAEDAEEHRVKQLCRIDGCQIGCSVDENKEPVDPNQERVVQAVTCESIELASPKAKDLRPYATNLG